MEKLICRRLYFKKLCYYTLITHCLPAMILWENCQFKNNEVTVQLHYSFAHLPYKMAVYKKIPLCLSYLVEHISWKSLSELLIKALSGSST